MDVPALQRALGVRDDGVWGALSRAALLDRFTNLSAAAVTVGEMQAFADRLGCSLRQIAAVASVESSGSGFDRDGRPKILFERHYFHRQTGGRWSPCAFSDARSGGYGVGSWSKLVEACGCDPDAAFASASWGRFQVMGAHWRGLGYESSFALAWSTVPGECGHFELLARFIEHNGLKDELRALSRDPDACRSFAKAYNGPGYERFDYHRKLARAMQ